MFLLYAFNTKYADDTNIEGFWRRRRRCRCGEDRRGNCECCYGRNTNGGCMSWWQAYKKRKKEQRVKQEKVKKLNLETKIDIENKDSITKSMIRDLRHVSENQK